MSVDVIMQPRIPDAAPTVHFYDVVATRLKGSDMWLEHEDARLSVWDLDVYQALISEKRQRHKEPTMKMKVI